MLIPAVIMLAATAAALQLRDLPYAHRPVTFDGGGWVTGIYAHNASGILYSRTDVGGAYRSDDGGASWIWLSGAIAAVDVWSTRGLAVNESDASGQTVLIAVGEDGVSAGSGIYKSADGGVSWRATLLGVTFAGNGNTRQASPVLAIDGARPWRVWAAAQDGLHLSVDAGESWEPVESFNTHSEWYNGSNSDVYAMSFVALPQPRADGTIDPTLTGHVLVAAQGMTGLALSTDDGASWTRVGVSLDGPAHCMYAAGPIVLSRPWRFLWEPNGTGWLGVDVASSRSSCVLRIEATKGALTTWNFTDITPVGGPWVSSYMSIDAPHGFGDPMRMVVGTTDASVLVTLDGGTTWTRHNTTVAAANRPIWFSPLAGHQTVPWGRNGVVTSRRSAIPGTLLLASGFGVVASQDEGDSWTFSSAGIGEVCMFHCHSHPTRPNYTFCGAEDLTGFVIADGGASGLAESSVFAHEPEFWSVDFGKGAAWTDPASGSVSLAFAGNSQLDGSFGQWIIWPDPAANVSFIPMSASSGALNNLSLQLTDLYQSPDDPKDLLLVSGYGWFGQWNSSMPNSKYSGGVVRSRDGGASWAHVAMQPTAGFAGIAETEWTQIQSDGGDADARWWAVGNIGVFVSRDRGETWSETNLTGQMWSLQAVAPDVVTGKGAAFVLVSTNHAYGPLNGTALRRTRDYGATYTVAGNFSVYANVRGYPFPAIASHPSGRLAVLAIGPGETLPHIWVTIDDCASWTALDSPAKGEYLAAGVTGLSFDAFDPTVLYVSTGGRSIVAIKTAA